MKICVFGNIGSGKTTLINGLTKNLNWEILAIDDFRRNYSTGSNETELIARSHFMNAIKSNHNQLIECTGFGQVAELLFNELSKLNEKIVCIILTTGIDNCKSRLRNRIWDIPFPHPLENLLGLMEKIDTQIKSSEISAKWYTLKNCSIIKKKNIIISDSNSILKEVLLIINQSLSKPSEIDIMLSPSVQAYYGNEYLSYQSKIIRNNDKFLADTKMITNFLTQHKFEGNILDIGAGSCQWFQVLEKTINHYFAIDTNKTALERPPRHQKLTTIVQNIFAENFNLNEVVNAFINYVLFSFFLSHFSDDQIIQLLKKTKDIDHIIIIDSFWGDKHQQKYGSKELSEIERKTSKDKAIELPKRFFDKTNLETLGKKLGFKITDIETGSYWFVCIMTKL